MLFRSVHLKGVHVGSAKLDFTPKTGDGITLVPHPDNFMVSSLTVTSSGRSTGWAIRANGGTQRSLRLDRTNLTGFTNGIEIRDALGGVDQTTVIRLQQARDLPADLRDELLQSAGESYPKGYESLLERYYRALSESEK